MLRLLLLILVILAAWQGKIHYQELMHPRQEHQVVVQNACTVAAERVRVTLGDDTQVRERIEPGASATFRFPTGASTRFKLVWLRADRTLESEWQGGQAGDRAERHVIALNDDQSRVEYHAEALPSNPTH